MIYYKVTQYGDGKQIFKYKSDNNTLKQTSLYLIEDELFTERERAKIANSERHFIKVEIPKTKIHYSFGARFEKGVYPHINGHKYTFN